MPNKEFGQETQHGPTQGLSLGAVDLSLQIIRMFGNIYKNIYIR